MSENEESSRVRDITDLTYEAASQSGAAKVRTQIYLSEEQRDFLDRESIRTGLSMAELIRQFIAEKMSPGEDVWESNPLLSETPDDPDFEGHEDGSENSDAIIYGSVSE